MKDGWGNRFKEQEVCRKESCSQLIKTPKFLNILIIIYTRRFTRFRAAVTVAPGCPTGLERPGSTKAVPLRPRRTRRPAEGYEPAIKSRHDNGGRTHRVENLNFQGAWIGGQPYLLPNVASCIM